MLGAQLGLPLASAYCFGLLKQFVAEKLHPHQLMHDLKWRKIRILPLSLSDGLLKAQANQNEDDNDGPDRLKLKWLIIWDIGHPVQVEGYP